MATQRPVGPMDYLALGIERSLDTITRGRAEERARQEKLADIEAEREFRKQQLAQEIALRKSIEENQQEVRRELAREAAQERTELQSERIGAQREIAAQMEAHRRDELAWRERNAEENRRRLINAEAERMIERAEQTGNIPQVEDFISRGFSQEEAERLTARAMTARQMREGSQEYKDAEQLRRLQMAKAAEEERRLKLLNEQRERLQTLINQISEIRAKPQTPETAQQIADLERRLAFERTALISNQALVYDPNTGLGLPPYQYHGENVPRPLSGAVGAPQVLSARPSDARTRGTSASRASATTIPQEDIIASKLIMERARAGQTLTPAEVQLVQRVKAAMEGRLQPEQTILDIERQFIERVRAGRDIPQWMNNKISDTRRTELRAMATSGSVTQTTAPSGSRGSRRAVGAINPNFTR